MAAPVRTCSYSALRLCRSICTTRAAQAGRKWREQHGLALNGSRYGPLTDLPDWSFDDGRPAPPMKGQQRRRRESEELSRRVVTLSTEMDGGMEACARRREEAERTEEHRRSLLLKPKGSLLLKKSEQ